MQTGKYTLCDNTYHKPGENVSGIHPLLKHVVHLFCDWHSACRELLAEEHCYILSRDWDAQDAPKGAIRFEVK